MDLKKRVLSHGALALTGVLGIAAAGSLFLAYGQAPGSFARGQHKETATPEVIAHGKTLYEVSCRGCHGADLRGGDMGGPNLLRSQVALSDQNGELIVPIIQGSRQAMGMPNTGLKDDDAKAVAAYVRSVIGKLGSQGKPPSEGQQELNILVGDATKGKAYFTSKCSNCHSPEDDLKGLATRVKDPKRLQNMWVAGGSRARFAGPVSPKAIATAKVTVDGKVIEGELVAIDDFLVTLKLSDGTVRSITRKGDDPKVVVNDPLEAHKKLLGQYTDDDVHNVTAYLVTLK